MTEEQAQEMVQLPRSIVLAALPMLFWVSNAIVWDDPEHQRVLRELFRAAADATGFINVPEVDQTTIPQPSPLTLEMVETAVAEVREVLNEQYTHWTTSRRVGGHDALDLFMQRLRQQMGGGQG